MIYLANSFSLQMLNMDKVNSIIVSPISLEEVKGLNFVSAVGHADTATVLSSTLGINIPMNRVNISLTPGDVLSSTNRQEVARRQDDAPEGFCSSS